MATDLEFHIDVDPDTGREMVMVSDTQQVGLPRCLVCACVSTCVLAKPELWRRGSKQVGSNERARANLVYAGTSVLWCHVYDFCGVVL